MVKKNSGKPVIKIEIINPEAIPQAKKNFTEAVYKAYILKKSKDSIKSTLEEIQ